MKKIFATIFALSMVMTLLLTACGSNASDASSEMSPALSILTFPVTTDSYVAFILNDAVFVPEATENLHFFVELDGQLVMIGNLDRIPTNQMIYPRLIDSSQDGKFGVIVPSITSNEGYVLNVKPGDDNCPDWAKNSSFTLCDTLESPIRYLNP